jgi:predicted lipoprotein
MADDAAALERAIAEATTAPGGRDDAREAWQTAMATWQQLELTQFGPLGSSLDVMGGEDLRARTYTWPLLNPCQVDQQTVEDGHDDPDAIEGTKGAPLGLWAIEYLLFNESPDNSCTALNTINRDGTWDAMADMIPARRLEYAAALATLVRRRVDDLVEAWSPDGGNYIEELTNPGRSGAVYGSAQEGLNAVSDAMFYLEKESKDMKLAKPLGITGCAESQCPDDLESRWAAWSKPHVLANLRAFELLFHGGAADAAGALGYDDLLVDMGAADVADDMQKAIDAAIAATEAVPGTFREALSQDPAAMEQAHTAIQAVTDILKSDFLTILDLEAPDRAAGDND